MTRRRRTPPLAAAGLCALALVGTQADTVAPTSLEKDIRMESAKRRAPTAQPVVHKGIRYEQLRRPMDQGFDQSGGVLAAIDVASGKQLWVTQLFKTAFDPKEERDAQEVYVSQLAYDAKTGVLLATDERKRRWRINPADGSTVLAAPATPAK